MVFLLLGLGKISMIWLNLEFWDLCMVMVYIVLNCGIFDSDMLCNVCFCVSVLLVLFFVFVEVFWFELFWFEVWLFW